MQPLSITRVKHKGNHTLKITFSDGKIVSIDFAPFIFSNPHPDYRKFEKEEHFTKFNIIDGNLNWDDYTMIFPIEDLYHGKLAT